MQSRKGSLITILDGELQSILTAVARKLSNRTSNGLQFTSKSVINALQNENQQQTHTADYNDDRHRSHNIVQKYAIQRPSKLIDAFTKADMKGLARTYDGTLGVKHNKLTLVPLTGIRLGLEEDHRLDGFVSRCYNIARSNENGVGTDIRTLLNAIWQKRNDDTELAEKRILETIKSKGVANNDIKHLLVLIAMARVVNYYGGTYVEQNKAKTKLQEENAQLKTEKKKNKNLEAENAKLQEEKTKLQEAKTKLQAKLANLAKENKNLEAKNKESQAENKNLEAENAQLKTENAKLKTENAKLEEAKTKLKTENTELEKGNPKTGEDNKGTSTPQSIISKFIIDYTKQHNISHEELYVFFLTAKQMRYASNVGNHDKETRRNAFIARYEQNYSQLYPNSGSVKMNKALFNFSAKFQQNCFENGIYGEGLANGRNIGLRTRDVLPMLANVEKLNAAKENNKNVMMETFRKIQYNSNLLDYFKNTYKNKQTPTNLSPSPNRQKLANKEAECVKSRSGNKYLTN